MIAVKVNGDFEIKVEQDKNHANKGVANGVPYVLDVNSSKKNAYHIIANNKSYEVELMDFNAEEKKYQVLINGNPYELGLKDDLDLLLESMGMGAGSAKVSKELKAPMPGLVINILVEEGAEVKKGDTLLILEAMKMENSIKAIADGEIKKISVSKGIAVEKNQILVVFA